MFPELRVGISLIALLYSTYTDFKSRMIPDWLTHGIAVVGLLIAFFQSYEAKSIDPMLLVGATTLATFIVAYGFWKLGAWAGGDVKLFTALATLNPLNYFVLGNLFNLSFAWNGAELLHASSLPFFMLNLFMLSVIMLMPYTALLALQALGKKHLRGEFVILSKNALLRIVQHTGVIVLLSFVLQQLQLSLWLLLPVLIVSAFLPQTIRWLFAGVAIAGLVAQLIPIADSISLFAVLLLVEMLLAWYGFARKHVLTYKEKISNLKEGDIPGELFVRENGKVVKGVAPSLKTIINSAKAGDVMGILHAHKQKGEVIANPASAAGLLPEQIHALNAAVKRGDIPNEIMLKASSPFAPAVLMAYVLLQLLGDGPLAWWFG
ncbi:MAG: prepilin peptidase [Candidatus Iainarchaeum archaeon]|uniref:Prepilin peptidase n=1 Tax=Candidatus Iainarchaeum sp. TaxID=3101447 RepID=A0A7T9I1S6_9ARCH|nr:MAG: prepilin peptidase [Candidatus Diapherotrites archaeon]